MNNEEFYNKYDATVLGNVKILGYLPREYFFIFASKDNVYVLPFELNSRHLIVDLKLDPSFANDNTREYIYRESLKFGPMEIYYIDKENNIISAWDYLELDYKNQKKFNYFYKKIGEK